VYNIQTIYLHVAVVIQFGERPECSGSCHFRIPPSSTERCCLLLACRWPNGEWVTGWWGKKRFWKKQLYMFLFPTPRAVQSHFEMQAQV